MNDLPADVIRLMATKLPLNALACLARTSERYYSMLLSNVAAYMWGKLIERDFPGCTITNHRFTDHRNYLFYRTMKKVPGSLKWK